MLVLIMIFAGCSSKKPDLSEKSTNTIINLLMNEKERSVFLVGDKHTYIYQDKLENTEYVNSQYHAVNQLITLLRDAKSFTFTEGPEVTTWKRMMLDGTVNTDSSIKLTIDLKPTAEQIAYFDTLKWYTRHGVSHYRFNKHSSGTLALSSKKSRCFVGICDDRYVDYTLKYHDRDILTIDTTEQMKQIPSKLDRNIVAEVRIRKIKEPTKAQLEKERKERIAKSNNQLISHDVGVGLSVLPLMIVAIPIALTVAVLE